MGIHISYKRNIICDCTSSKYYVRIQINLCWMAAILELLENLAYAMVEFMGIFIHGQVWYKETHFRWENFYWNFAGPPYMFRRSFTRLLWYMLPPSDNLCWSYAVQSEGSVSSQAHESYQRAPLATHGPTSPDLHVSDEHHYVVQPVNKYATEYSACNVQWKNKFVVLGTKFKVFRILIFYFNNQSY